MVAIPPGCMSVVQARRGKKKECVCVGGIEKVSQKPPRASTCVLLARPDHSPPLGGLQCSQLEEILLLHNQGSVLTEKEKNGHCLDN